MTEKAISARLDPFGPRTAEELRRAAFHEAGHVIVSFAMSDEVRIRRVTIDPPTAKRAAGLGGFIETEPPEDPPLRLVEDRPPPETDEDVQLARRVVRFLGQRYLGGLAAEFPSATGWCPEMDASGEYDMDTFSRLVRLEGLDREFWPLFHETLDKARRAVDRRWGQVEALAEALLERGTLRGAEIDRVAAAAPRKINKRPVWPVREGKKS